MSINLLEYKIGYRGLIQPTVRTSSVMTARWFDTRIEANALENREENPENRKLVPKYVIQLKGTIDMVDKISMVNRYYQVILNII